MVQFHSQGSEYQQVIAFLVKPLGKVAKTKCIYCEKSIAAVVDRHHTGNVNLSEFYCPVCDESFLLNDEETKSTRSIKELLCK